MSEAKKIKLSEDFKERGRFDDEITLRFDDGKELFVSKSFLCMASPVFDAMLTREFKEKRKKKVQMEGKNCDSFLQFLLCIHPAVMAPITDLTLSGVTPLAEEYQHDVLIMRCKEAMKRTLNNGHIMHLNASKNLSTKWKSINSIAWMLVILRISSELNYDAIKQMAIEYLGKCSHIYYCGNKWFQGCPLSEEAKKEKATSEKIYQSLPESLKIQVMFQRLENIDC